MDLHTHGVGRYDTRTAEPEEILKTAELHAKSGTAAFLPTIYPASVSAMRNNIEAVARAMEIQQSGKMQDARCKPNSSLITHCSSQILGVHLEGPFLNPVKCGALDKDSFIRPSLSGLKRLIDGYEDIVKIITIAPEMQGALRVVERCREIGIRVNMGHSDATYKEALNGKKAGATGVTHIFNAMRPFHHREPGLAGFGLLDEETYTEVIADGVHLGAEALRLIFSVKRLDRIILVSDSIKGAGKGKGPIYNSKGILAGSGSALFASSKVLMDAGVSRDAVRKAGIENPAAYLNA